LRKATVNIALFVRPHGASRLPKKSDFYEIWYLSFSKICQKIQVLLKWDKNGGTEWRYFTWRPIYIFLSYLAQFFLEWKKSETKFE
jgi:hypothetical protein